jgi:hypothetical protein
MIPPDAPITTAPAAATAHNGAGQGSQTTKQSTPPPASKK